MKSEQTEDEQAGVWTACIHPDIICLLLKANMQNIKCKCITYATH
jgi:hypothetical protein